MSAPRQPEHLLPRTAVDPDGTAVTTDTTELSWSELERRGRRLAQAIRAAGLDEGDAVAILSPNRIEWAELVLGNARAGTRYVPLNWHCTVPELAALLADSGAKLLVTDHAHAAAGREAAATSGVGRVIELGEEYDAWRDAASDEVLEEGRLGAALQYTGGTTGPSRGVIRPDTHGTTSQFADVHGRWAALTGMPREGRALLVTPAYHALGGAVLRSALVAGLPLTILDRWNEELVLRTIEDHRITATAMVPTQFLRLLKLDPDTRRHYDVSSLQWVLHTAAPCPAWAKHAMIEWFGPVVVELYGSSEGAGPFVCTSAEWLERPGTVGRPRGAMDVTIVDEDGEDLPHGEVGMVYVRRQDGAPEYHGDPEKTAAMQLPDGRFTVGDMGWLDEDGYLFLADRRVDLVLTGGSNVYPAEIEAVLSEHPTVGDVAVFGLPDPEWGQVVMAVVEPAPGQLVDVRELTDHCREQLASYKVPKRIEVVPSLPREASGKLKKRLLRDRYVDQTA
jgi:long-chain acyl-CoA synthetase